MTDIVRLEHVGIPATEENFDQVVSFYERAFGWSTLVELAGPPRIKFITDGNGGVIEVLQVGGDPMAMPAHLAFAVPIGELDGVKQRVVAAGIEFDQETLNPVGDRLAWFNDPAGNRAQIVGRNKPLH